MPSADVYLLKFVLHDWDDAQCVTLLSNIRRAMNPGARVVIVEMIVNDEHPTTDAAMMDIAMLYALGGQERNAAQFQRLLNEAGLTTSHQHHIRGSYGLIEATAV